MIVDDKGNVFENRRKNKEDRRQNKVDSIGGRRNADRRKPSSQEKNKEVNR